MTLARMALAAGLLAATAATGCRENAPPTPRQALAEPTSPAQARPTADDHTDADGPASPADTVRLVNTLRRAGRLQEMARFVAQDRREAVLELIEAVDRLALDNRSLQRRFQDAGQGAVGTLFDRSEVANIIGVFSTDVEVIKEELAGGSAVVTIQVGRRVPLEEVSLRLQDDRWTVMPDPPIPGLADELRNLGTALRRVGEAVSRKEMTAEEIAREMDFWQRPVMKRIARLVEQAEQNQPHEDSEKP